MITWNYCSKQASSTGYEEMLPTLAQYTQERYLAANAAEQQKMVEEVFRIYRTLNIFPITYYNNDGISREIKKCIDKDIEWDGKVLNHRFVQGNSLCKFFMPNLFDVIVRDKPMTQYKQFYDDEGLRKAIAFCLRYDSGVRPTQLLGGLRMTSSVAGNFLPMRAKALYEHFVPANGVIWDYCMGFGGRMLGALTSKNNYTYIGTDPNTETYEHLQQLGTAIEKVTGRTGSYDIFCEGAETFCYPNESIDFAFSSPPYFTLERYSDEETQSYNRFDELTDWLEGFVRPTVKNIYNMLKPDRFYAVNIADFKVNNKQVSFVDDWKRISEEEGFTFIRNIPMKISKRTGKVANEKEEGVFVFYKPVQV